MNLEKHTLFSRNTPPRPATAETTASAQPPEPVMEALARTPRACLDDVFLSQGIRDELALNLAMIRNHALLYEEWGLARIEPQQRGVVLNFYGPPGTGKTKTAEAMAHELGKTILEANYAVLVSELQGKTGKNIEAVFNSARAENAVLFFDEADSLLSRRAEGSSPGGGQDLNTAKSIMLKQLDQFDGVVIFATNLFRNYDSAFFRRISAHIHFDLPCAQVREQLWRFMLSPNVPGRENIDMAALVASSEGLAGGDIANVVKQTLGRLLMKSPRLLTQDDLTTRIDRLREARNAQQGIGERVLQGEEKAAALRKFGVSEPEPESRAAAA
jgi:ATP-dependent 26S proteasome regulatory subunit